MNKRFSTLLAVALVASGLSAFAQQPDGELIYSTFNKVKDGERMQLASAGGSDKSGGTVKVFVVGADKGHQVLKGFDLKGRGEGDLAASKIDTTSYAGLDSTLWTVTVKLSGTSRSYSFTNSKGAKLVVPTVTNAKNGDGGKIAAADLTLVNDGISEWSYSDKKQCFYAFNNDSVFYLGSSSDQTGVELYSVKGDSEDAITGGGALFVARYPQASLTLDAKSFNQMLKKSHGKLFFHQSVVEGAPVTNNAGDNILTAKTWKAYQANVASENVEDSIPALKQWSWGKGGKGLGQLFPELGDDADSLLVLWSTGDNKALVVDTAYLTGTTSDTIMTVDGSKGKMKMPAWKLNLADTVPTFGVNPLLATKTSDEGEGKYNRPIGSVAFVVKINVATDSISIRPYNLPKYNKDTNAFSDSLITDFTMQEKANQMVEGNFTVPTPALRVLGKSVYLAMDTVAEGNANKVYYPLIRPYENRPAIGGNAVIDVKNVYFLKLAGENFNAGNMTDANYAGQYLYAPLSVNGVSAAEGLEATDLELAKTATVDNISSQWIAVKGNADGNYSILNRSTGMALFAGAIDKVEKIGTKTVKDTYLIGGDTIQLVNAKAKLAAKGEKDHAGYFYADANKLTNKSYQITSAFEYLADRYMQGDEKAVALIDKESAMFLEVVGDNVEYGAESDDVPALFRSTYKLKDANGLYVNGVIESGAKTYVMGAAASAAVFYIKTFAKDQYALIDTTGNLQLETHYYAVTLDAQAKAPTLKGQKIKENSPTPLAFASSAPAEVEPAMFTITPMKTPAVLFNGRGHKTITFGNDMMTIGKGDFALAARVGDELKAGYVSEDFTFYLDSVNYKDEEKASYYVSKAIANPTEEQEGFRMYLTLADKDSILKENNPYTYKSGEIRYLFRPAMRYGVDSLIVFNAKQNDDDVYEMVKDTINIDDNTAAVKGFRFQFETILGEDGSYLMKTDDNNYVKMTGSDNALVSADKYAASKLTLAVAEIPTSNDAINADDNTISVVAGEGNVTVYGAAGKTIIVSDVVGHNTEVIATSDAETISAPAGVVIVKVGEFVKKTVVD